MLRRAALFLALALLMAIGAAACDTYLPRCEASSLSAPSLASPADAAIVDSGLPALSWIYPDDCYPDHYRVDLTDSTFDLNNLGDTTDEPTTSWHPTTSLVVGRNYFWRVAPVVGSTVGPYSSTHRFIVGPVCEPGELVAPDPFAPEPDQRVYHEHQGFAWTYPHTTCQPEGYRLQISATEDFSSLVVDKRESEPIPTWSSGVVLDDCTRYYWRVAAISGAADGPWSSVETFHVDYDGLCETCTAEALVAPEDLAPNGETVVLDPDTYLYLSGTYPLTTCRPDHIEAYVWQGVEPETPGMTARVPIQSDGSWSIPWGIPLEPGNMYRWRAYAGLETGPGPDVDGPSALGYFFTGPMCPGPEGMLPVDLINPADETIFGPTDSVTFAWDDPTECHIRGLYEIQISLTADFSEYLHRIPILQNVWTMTAEEIPLEPCTRYYWRIKTDPSGPLEEPFSDVWSFFVQPPDVICPPDLLDLEIPAMVTAEVDHNCRSGPYTDARNDDTFFAGASAPIQARNADGTWFQILSPNLRLACWIWSGRTVTEGDLSRVPVVYVAPPPTRVPTPIVCADYTTQQMCVSNPACQWVVSVGAPNLLGHCENR